MKKTSVIALLLVLAMVAATVCTAFVFVSAETPTYTDVVSLLPQSEDQISRVNGGIANYSLQDGKLTISRATEDTLSYPSVQLNNATGIVVNLAETPYLHLDFTVPADGEGINGWINYKVGGEGEEKKAQLSDIAGNGANDYRVTTDTYLNFAEYANCTDSITITSVTLSIYGVPGASVTWNALAFAKEGTDEPASDDVIEEQITVDGKLDDTGWTKAAWKTINSTTGTQQTQSASDPDNNIGNLEYKFAVRTDDENVYVAVKVNALPHNCPEAEAMDNKVSLGTHFRFYITLDEDIAAYGKDGAIIASETLLDILVENDGSLGVYKSKTLTTDAKAVMTKTETDSTYEISFKKSLFGIGESFRMATSYSDNHFGEAENKYNVLNDHKYDVVNQSTDAPWVTNMHYAKYVNADLAIGTFDVIEFDVLSALTNIDTEDYTIKVNKDSSITVTLKRDVNQSTGAIVIADNIGAKVDLGHAGVYFVGDYSSEYTGDKDPEFRIHYARVNKEGTPSTGDLYSTNEQVIASGEKGKWFNWDFGAYVSGKSYNVEGGNEIKDLAITSGKAGDTYTFRTLAFVNDAKAMTVGTPLVTRTDYVEEEEKDEIFLDLLGKLSNADEADYTVKVNKDSSITITLKRDASQDNAIVIADNIGEKIDLSHAGVYYVGDYTSTYTEGNGPEFRIHYARVNKEGTPSTGDLYSTNEQVIASGEKGKWFKWDFGAYVSGKSYNVEGGNEIKDLAITSGKAGDTYTFRTLAFVSNADMMVLGTPLVTRTDYEEEEPKPEGTNIALNRPYTGAVPSTHDQVKGYNAKLTDGKYENMAMSYGKTADEWFAFYYSAAATGEGNINVTHIAENTNVGELTIDLKALSTIESVRIHFNKSYMDATVKVEVSADGTDFTLASETAIQGANPDTGFPGDGEQSGSWGRWVTFDGKNLEGRYVKISFTFTDKKMYCIFNEVEVIGIAGEEVTADYSDVEAAIAEADELVEGNYTEESWNALQEAIDAVEYDLPVSQQAKVDAMAKAIRDAIAALEESADVPDADYTEVNVLVEVYEKLKPHKDDYTTESWTALETAVNAVTEGKKANEQATVDGWAEAILTAIAGLTKATPAVGKADYTAVNVLLTVKDSLTEDDYTAESWKALEDAVAAVVEGKTADQQSEVNAMAEAIADAIANLEKKAPSTDTPSKPDDSKPDDSKPDDSKPDDSKPDDSKPSSTPSSTPSSNPSNSSDSSSSPQTGDSSIVVFALLAVLALAGAIVAVRTRH